VRLDDPAAIARSDRHDARAVLAAFPAQCRAAVALRPTPIPAPILPRAIVVAGVGGSAAGGDLLAAWGADHLDVPVIVHRGYDLPSLAGHRDLVIVSSYSGDTAESLSAAETAVARGCHVVAVTSGGRLAVLAASRRWPLVALPAGLMPRMALGYLFLPLLGIVRCAGLATAKETEVEEALGLLEELAQELAPQRAADVNQAKRVALAIADRLPVVYGGPTTAAVAYRWKTDLEENGKTFAVAGTLPEMNHNEIEAWRAPRTTGFHLVLLRDTEESPEMTSRFALLHELVAPVVGGVSEVWSRGSGSLARLLGLAYLGQWVSFYLAVLRGVDPWAVPTLDAFKARLAATERPRA
jgi:glucose/mannose-6-phosphate isomerase